ncbi:TPA: hypothetical protein EYN98_12435 [Candidatus Poribacteria bacterium]|nr:hypothetical protein [Candidatus Poribacteria bacterium]HIA66844.1 hypothetical protein [Candidatus Poribacteria bacterium]HIB92194.1 hypothetical protein [Candidatus Poribacteria bacterium]HIM10477.1 hypothetical protein [Candidatus Poribacteria bacterium]HIN32125.1 hypothetical protein [Candidatus Poribacteria bacterium]
MALTKANQVAQSVAQLLVAEADKALLADNLQWLVFLVANVADNQVDYQLLESVGFWCDTTQRL